MEQKSGSARLWSVLCVLVALAATSAAHAQGKVYKWVDEHGNVLYTDKSPESASVKSREVKIPAPPPPLPATQRRPSWQEQAQEVDRRMIRSQNEAPTGPANAQLCADARQRLASINAMEGRRIARIDEKGERSYMEDGERAAIREQATQSIAAYCGQ